jgi:hypothetical protein
MKELCKACEKDCPFPYDLYLNKITNIPNIQFGITIIDVWMCNDTRCAWK